VFVLGKSFQRVGLEAALWRWTLSPHLKYQHQLKTLGTVKHSKQETTQVEHLTVWEWAPNLEHQVDVVVLKETRLAYGLALYLFNTSLIQAKHECFLFSSYLVREFLTTNIRQGWKWKTLLIISFIRERPVQFQIIKDLRMALSAPCVARSRLYLGVCSAESRILELHL
jgi:hypothetical protein